MDNLELIFDEFVLEASKGHIETDPFIYNTQFHTIYGDNNYTGNKLCLKIRDKKAFLFLLSKYLFQLKKYRNIELDYNTIKESITLLFSNITYEELLNPEEYIKRYIDFYDGYLEDKTINDFTSFNADKVFLRKNKDRKEQIEALKKEETDAKTLAIKEREYHEGLLGAQNRNKDFWNSNIIISSKMQSLRQETPYFMEIKFEKEVNGKLLTYLLPRISYGISNDTCYIYAVQNEVTKNEIDSDDKKYRNMISRALYELNDGVYENESQDYKNYKEGRTTEFAENISDVSPSAILALSTFLNVLSTCNINKVKVVPFLPIRYNAKEKANYKKVQFVSKKQELDFMEKVALFKKMKIEHNMIQDNLTNKFIRNFMRLKYHFNNLDILNIPFEGEEMMSIRLNEFTLSNSEILNEIIEKTGELKRDKNL
jgi:hypothetical protein